MITHTTHMNNKRYGFTLIELVVVLAVLALLASILLPIFNQVRTINRSPTGELNLRQLGYATIQYEQDNEEKGPRAGDDCLSHRTTPALFHKGEQNQCGGDSWQDVIAPYLKTKRIFQSPDDNSAAGGPPAVSQGSIAAALSRGAKPPFSPWRATNFRTTDGNLSYVYNNLLSHQMHKTKNGYSNPAARNLASDGVPLAGIKDPTQCVLLLEGHGGWDVTHVDTKAIIRGDWTGSTDLQNKWHHAYGVSNETFFLVSTSYSGLSFIHSGLPFPDSTVNVMFCDGHSNHKAFLDADGHPNLCQALPWAMSMDPNQLGAEKDSCRDPKNPVGAGWGTSNWF